MDFVDGQHTTNLVILCIVIGCTISLSANLVLFRPGLHLGQPVPAYYARVGCDLHHSEMKSYSSLTVVLHI